MALLASESAAFADEPAVSGPSETAKVTPLPGQAAASAPSRASVPITATCSLGAHAGVDEAEARTGAELICNELARLAATNTSHEVTFGKLGSKIVVTLASRKGNAYDERRVFLSAMDELTSAAPRLVSALVEGQTIEQTKTSENLLDSETREPKVQRGQMGFSMGLFAMTSLGKASAPSGGFDLGLDYRGNKFGAGLHGRAGGIGSGDTKIGTASLDVGLRYFLSNAEVAPFVGGGLGINYFHLMQDGSDGSGIGAFGEVGLELLRLQRVAVLSSLRVDAPFYALKSNYSRMTDAPSTPTPSTSSTYVLPVSLNVAITFR